MTTFQPPTVVRMVGTIPDNDPDKIRRPIDPEVLYIGRSLNMAGWRLKTSKWHNPYKVGRDGTLPQILNKYREHVESRPDLVAALPELSGRKLGCWCKAPGKSSKGGKGKDRDCHGDILVELFQKYVIS